MSEYHAQIVARYLARHETGERIADIAAAFGYAPGTIASILRKAGVPPDGRRIHNNVARDKAILDRYMAREETGETARTIAAAFGLAENTVRAILNKAGIVLRRDEAREREIVTRYLGRYEAGETVVDVAAYYDISTVTLWNILCRHDIPRSGRYVRSPEVVRREAAVLRYRKAGMRNVEIARELDITPMYVSKIIYEAKKRVS